MSGRFPAPVAQVLLAAGWQPGRDDLDRARRWAGTVGDYAAPGGHHHTVVEPALHAFAEFGGVRVHVGPDDAAGEQVARRGFTIDPRQALPTVRTLAAFAATLGAPLTPLGVEHDGVGLLAIDAHGRVFALDHTTDWYLGGDLDAALHTLVLGRAPARVTADGSWQ